jgi:hypothetical protein
MEVQRDYMYQYEELKKCNLCRNWIEDDIRRVYFCNKRCYYHPLCYNLMIQKMESLGFLYSC